MAKISEESRHPVERSLPSLHFQVIFGRLTLGTRLYFGFG